jgi:uncharacterized protein YbcI
MTDSQSTADRRDGSAMAAVANVLIALHKEQFGRGPRKARADFAGPDALVCVMYDALLPAERAMVDMGEQQRVRESRMFLQVATSPTFVRAIEEIVYRKVFAFASASDPDQGVVMEIFVFEPESTDGAAPELTTARS